MIIGGEIKPICRPPKQRINHIPVLRGEVAALRERRSKSEAEKGPARGVSGCAALSRLDTRVQLPPGRFIPRGDLSFIFAEYGPRSGFFFRRPTTSELY